MLSLCALGADGSSDPRRQLSFASLAELPPPATPPLRTLGILNLDGYYYPTQVASAPFAAAPSVDLKSPLPSEHIPSLMPPEPCPASPRSLAT